MLSKKELVDLIINKVRNACQEQSIESGAIGVCFVPEPGLIDEWMDAPRHSTGELYIAPVTEGGSTRPKKTSDCAGIVAMKIAGLKLLMEHYDEEGIIPARDQCTSGSLPNEMTGNGISNWKGAIAIQLGVRTGIGCHYRGNKALTVYVGVSGGTQLQDEAAAWTALDVLKEAIKDDPDIMLARMYYD